MKFISCFILSLFLLITVKVSGQGNPTKLVTANFAASTIDQFTKEIESKTSYHFYYDIRLFDSLRVTLNVNQEPVDSVLKKAFQGTAFNYTIDPNDHIFLTKKREILTVLPPGLFEEKIPAAAIAVASTPVLTPIKEIIVTDLSTAKDKEISTIAIENRLFEVGIKTNTIRPGNSNLTGYLRNIDNGEPVVGATVFIDNPRVESVTDGFGYFSLIMPRGLHTVYVKGIGLRDTKRRVMLYADGKFDINAEPQILSLKEVVISKENASNVRNVQMGVEKISIETIKQVPVAFGEADIMKVMLTLPGVKSVGEAANGFNVRGGAIDQNLILFDDMVVYNPSHFFGFFSAFNPDVVKDLELYKSSIPPKYGGRLSSVMDVNSRDGNMKKITGTGGLGLITSRISLEGPIIKDKTSFIMAARTTYSNWILQALPSKAGYKDSKASFYDMNLRLNHQINERNNLYLTGYISNDNSNLNSDTLFSYKNMNGSLKWKHLFSTKLTMVVVAGYSQYQYSNYSDHNPVTAYQLDFDIAQGSFKTDFNYYLNKHTIDFGISSLKYQLHPGSFQPRGAKSLIIPDTMSPEQALESAAYIGDKFDVTPDLSFNFGVRYSMFNNLGPQGIRIYVPDKPRSSITRIDSVTFQKNDIVKTYKGPEIRFSARYSISSDLSVKAGYNTQRQYIHMLTNTTAISPTDIWKLSDPNIRPQYGDQISLGIYKNYKSNTVETSIEVYYKRLKDYLDYKSGASLVLNHHIETDVINTQGKAYGAEFLVKKLTGKLNGWVTYTYSRTLLKMDDPNAGEVINDGNYYPSNYDKPHDFTFVGNFRYSHRFSTSMNITYSTGRPITVPIGKYYYSGAYRALYSDRNGYRIPDYFRMDFSMIVEGNHRIHQWTHSSWSFGVYNMTGKKNAYSTYFLSENHSINGYKLSIFGSPIPFVNYNIKF